MTTTTTTTCCSEEWQRRVVVVVFLEANGALGVRNVCNRGSSTDRRRRHLAQMHTPAEGGASPEGPSPIFSPVVSLSLPPSRPPLPPSTSRGRCSLTAINLPPRRRAPFPPRPPARPPPTRAQRVVPLVASPRASRSPPECNEPFSEPVNPRSSATRTSRPTDRSRSLCRRYRRSCDTDLPGDWDWQKLRHVFLPPPPPPPPDRCWVNRKSLVPASRFNSTSGFSQEVYSASILSAAEEEREKDRSDRSKGVGGRERNCMLLCESCWGRSGQMRRYFLREFRARTGIVL